jgi:hypothetical protein
MSRKVNIFTSLSGITPGCADLDVQAFLTATGITDTTIEDALCVLVTAMKADGTWAKMQALYPIVGGSATAHKFNLKNPADTDAAFRLSFLGGWTHSANGALPNGVNGYARTFWNGSVQAAADSVSFGFYSRTNITGANYIYGSFASSGTKRIWHNFNGNIQIADASLIFYTANPSTRLFISYRDSINYNESFRDGSSLGNTPTLMTTLPNLEFFFGALNNNGSPSSYTRHEMSFGFLGNALTPTDVANLTTNINTFETSLGRNV